MPKTNAELAQRAWRSLSGDERIALYEGRLNRSDIIRRFGERFNTPQRLPITVHATAWTHLMALLDNWKEGREDDGSEEESSV